MDIDTSQPWGLAIDFAGRATITEAGHTVYINVADTSVSNIIGPDSLTGTYSPVHVTAQFTEKGAHNTVLRGGGMITVMPVGTDPVVPDQTAIQQAVAAALADFADNVSACTALCAQWTSPGDGSGGTGDPAEPPADGGTDPLTAAEATTDGPA
ncbi:ATP-binding protein [Streptomyces sp. NPDC056161]|uniref:ATP-binding protein n=1 Tax=Streptomyces sp. NPDC056161 TaxID=3345732 RepID=UPI0035DA1976